MRAAVDSQRWEGQFLTHKHKQGVTMRGFTFFFLTISRFVTGLGLALGACGCQRDASNELVGHLTNNTVVWEASSVIRTNYISSANYEGTTVGLLGLKEYSQGATPIDSGFAVVIEDEFFNSLVANSFRSLHREPRWSGEWVYSVRSRSLVVFERQGERLVRRRYSGFKRLWISVSREHPPRSDSPGVPGE